MLPLSIGVFSSNVAVGVGVEGEGEGLEDAGFGVAGEFTTNAPRGFFGKDIKEYFDGDFHLDIRRITAAKVKHGKRIQIHRGH
ncbi:unnamed protein product [Pseudo-nitzschia multistriata]|uniref:Uncharacterized protein n=1 Tax=Pseudo-nitzschia multistriata TaxID=183589 RepID=A0A448ZDZ0_9STRA|nr:unnamed protein product [Pseudo-nitzschia multistriata]